MTAKPSRGAGKKRAPVDLAAHRRTDAEKQIQERRSDDLKLDPNNPRLAEFSHTGTQASIQAIMQKHFDLQPIKDSLYRNGFFYEEPLVVIEEPLTEFGSDDVLVVVEGNRRLAAIREVRGNPAEYPDATARERLAEVPVVIRDTRDETLAFVGFRHVTGIKEWKSPAKAQYAHHLVMAGYTLDEIAHLIGDTTRQVDRWVRTHSLLLHANQIGLSQEDAVRGFYFSYLLTATDARSTQKWLGLTLHPAKGTVANLDDEKLKQLWTWLYGSKEREAAPVVPESRQIHKLNRVLSVGDATRELEKTGNLDRAFAYTKSRDEYVASVLGEARSMLQDMYTTVYLDGPLEETDETRENVIAARDECGKILKVVEKIQNDLGL